jgi:hypothetical protein
MQTPQIFARELLERAYANGGENLRLPTKFRPSNISARKLLVPNDEWNVKITYPRDRSGPGRAGPALILIRSRHFRNIADEFHEAATSASRKRGLLQFRRGEISLARSNWLPFRSTPGVVGPTRRGSDQVWMETNWEVTAAAYASGRYRR